MTVDDVKRELNFAQHEAALRSVKNYWRKLKTLELSAAKNPRNVSRYRELLQQGVDSLQHANEAKLTATQIIERIGAMAVHFNETFAENDGSQKERERGALMGKWMEKWHPAIVQEARKAMADLWDTEPDSITEAMLKRGNKALDAYLDTYFRSSPNDYLLKGDTQ